MKYKERTLRVETLDNNNGKISPVVNLTFFWFLKLKYVESRNESCKYVPYYYFTRCSNFKGIIFVKNLTYFQNQICFQVIWRLLFSHSGTRIFNPNEHTFVGNSWSHLRFYKTIHLDATNLFTFHLYFLQTIANNLKIKINIECYLKENK